jgi:branched-subunit amino acid aminotransferase/4-amino-4-deoxychorismate lyase
MSAGVTSIYRWHDGALEALGGPTPPVSGDASASNGRAGGDCDMTLTEVEAVDSWLVTEGKTLALDLHRTRFMTSIPRGRYRQLDPAAFWDAAIATIPSDGTWFPRVELHNRLGGPRLVFRLRSAPQLLRSAVLATWTGKDPRKHPRVKGPDLGRMSRLRTAVQPSGADEAVLLTPEGYVVEGAYSALLWWRGDILCGPLPEFDRIDSITARSVLTLARALGLDTHEEAVTPAELDGTELWVLSALHGIRIATSWVDGPALAEQPGRLATWRSRLDALRRPIHEP